MKKLSIVLLAILIALGSFGAAMAQELKLAIWDTNQEPGITEVLKDFTAETGIDVTVEITPWDQYWTMLEAAATGGALPDVFWMHSNEIGRYASYDILMDLTDRIAESEIVDLSKFPEGITSIYNWFDKQFAIPKDYDTIGLWYNKTFFDEAGLAYPDETWDWAKLKEAARALTNDDHKGFLVKLSQNQEGWNNFVYQNGGELINEDKTESGFNNPKTVEAFKEVVSYIEEGLSPDGKVSAENGSSTFIQSGQVAMGTYGSWMLSEFKSNDYMLANCDVAVLPMGPDGTRATIYNGLGWAASANTAYPDEAWKLLEFLGSEAAQRKLSELGVAISAYEGTDEAWLGSSDAFNLKAYTDQLDYAVIRPYSFSTVAWENLALEKLAPVWAGTADLETVLDELTAEMNVILADEPR